MALSKAQRKQVWDKSGGVCWYCGNKLPEKGWHADHVDAVYRLPTKASYASAWGVVPESIQKLLDNGGMEKPENNKISNIVPACAPCNLFKSVFTVEQFRNEISFQVDRARKTSVNFRTAERFGLIECRPIKVVFWFEAPNSLPSRYAL
jgi:5-methylcytosine-specific restriction endonuclease McrA